MQTPHPIGESRLCAALATHYGIDARQVRFLPEGDRAFGYVVVTPTERYFLKLFDPGTAVGREGIAALDAYLPITRQLHLRQSAGPISHPRPARDDRLYAQTEDGVTLVLFAYIEGETLAEAYPFADAIHVRLAQAIARVHAATPHLDTEGARVERFDPPFLPGLARALGALPKITQKDGAEALALREFVLGRREQVEHFVELFAHCREKAQIVRTEWVFCHGDLWGGNVMVTPDGEYALLDWENARLAPRECDLLPYTGEPFAFFLRAYEAALGRSVRLSGAIFGYYAYRRELANLTQWLRRLLYEHNTPEQNCHDLECIDVHCMSRWPEIEARVEHLTACLDGADQDDQTSRPR